MVSKKTIDIIVPVYNQINVIESFLFSASTIDKEKVNIILVNDGSTDGTESKILEFISSEDKINFYLINKSNGGVSSARNAGLLVSTSKYIWFCDPDDVILDNLSNVLSVIENNQDADAFIFSYETYYTQNGILKQNIRSNEVLSGISFLVKYNSLSNDYWHPASDGTLWDKIYKREPVLDVFFNEGMICSEDFNFNLNVFKRIRKVIVSNELLYKYYVYANGTLSSTFNKKIFDNRLQAERDTISFLMKYKGSVRSEIKKHILKNVRLLSQYSDGDLFSFYKKEHEFFEERIYPVSSFREFIFIILSKLNAYAICIKLYRKTKKHLGTLRG
ncbi:glycosyltransferase [Serratia marcescens]|uniref:glycosyltransferase n=2 Tax=Serratia marcescens TaxID=615 RepID=UPI00066528A6|nr:glycosyltransferase [Serratia marcescens]